MNTEPAYQKIFLPGPDTITVTSPSSPHATPWGTQTAMRPDQAAHAIDYLRTHAPSDWADYLNLASAFYLSERDDEGMEMAERALSLHRATPTLLNMAIYLELYGRFSEAFPLAKEAHLMDTQDYIAGSLYADALVRNGDWSVGWPLHTHYHHGLASLRDYLPEWDGVSSLHNQRILVLEGGGFGDNIIFLRWLPTLKLLGAKRVTYGAPKSLIPLLLEQPNLLGADRFLPSFWEEIRTHNICKVDLSAYDCFISSLALPQVAGATTDDLHSPLGYPYFFADLSKSSLRRDTIRHSRIPHAGIVWRAGEGAYPRKYKSLSDDQLRRILRAQVAIEWVSLQYDATSPIPILTPAIRSWSDTAAIIDNLDLVVTVDTGVAHLAGAMGKRTFLLLPGRSSWPFLLHSSDACLYPSVRLFRNRGIGIDNAVDDLIHALEAR